MLSLLRVIIVVAAVIGPGEGARILCMFPTPAYSHQLVFRAYTQALLERGHELVVITPMPVNDHASSNLTEIDVSLSHRFFKRLIAESKAFKRRGIVSDVSTVTHRNYMGLVRMINEQFDQAPVKRLLATADRRHFDLIVTEAFISYPLVLSHFFDAPVIQMSSGYGLAENYETMGAVSRHPVYYPSLWRNRFRDLSVWQMVGEIYTELRLYFEFSKLALDEDRLIKRRFGQHVPSVDALRNNVQMLFLNTHSLFDNNRPVPPSVQYLGGLHLKESTGEMDSSLREFLDNSTAGVVYVSFGSGLRTADMAEEFLYVFLDTFRALPYNVLWKAEGVNDTLVPNNVLVQHWFPQRDVLNHRNVKAFVTQGGVQSTDEAIDSQVPLVGVPIMGDQSFNVNKYIDLGIGRAVDTLTVDARQLTAAILDVAQNSSYRSQLARLRRIVLDQPMKPMDKALWYTEHVIRHGNAHHLKTPAANVAWQDYLMLSIALPLVVAAVMNHFDAKLS